MSKKIPGTKISLQNSQLLVSSGVPSLDHVLGGGIPLGSVFLIEEDNYAKYSDVMFKFFISEGVVCHQNIMIATVQTNSEKLISELPAPTNAEIEEKPIKDMEENSNMKIAWRYNDLTPIQSSLDSSLQFAHYFDISKSIEKNIIENCSIMHWKFQNITEENESIYDNLISCIKKEINNGGFGNTKTQNSDSVLRIAIHSLGSPYWQMYENASDEIDDARDLLKFLYSLRALIHSTASVVLITMPTHLLKINVINHIQHLVDGCIKLEAFAGTDKESNPVLRDYHGLFYMPKLCSLNTLSPYVPATLDLAFKLRRKKFVIEKLHLPPELQDSTEREQDDGSLLSCSSMKKNNIDF